MLTYKKGCIAALLAVCLATGPLLAQETTKGKKPAAPAAVKSGNYKVVLLPDFFQYQPAKKGDTTFTYECYDKESKKIDIDEAGTLAKVHNIYYFKSYFQFPYKAGAVMSPPYLSKKLYSYENQGDNSWIGTDPFTDAQVGIKGDKNKIVRADTVTITNAVSKKKQSIIHKYYKTDKGAASATPHTHNH